MGYLHEIIHLPLVDLRISGKVPFFGGFSYSHVELKLMSA